MNKRPKGLLLLEDGRVFRGRLFGADVQSIGEVVFNTALTGYQEIITDPSYAGQIVVMTTPEIGNYGVNTEDHECERAWLSGFVCRNLSGIASNHRSTQTLDEFLRERNVPAIDGVDTRALTIHLRDNGAMRGVIAPWTDDTSELLERVKAAPTMEGQNLVKVVSDHDPYDLTVGYESSFSEDSVLSHGDGPALKCAAIDYGAKSNILRCLVQVGFQVRVFSSETSVDEILAWEPDCVFLSNGPGDPAALPENVETIKTLLAKRMPMFGICLGHQLLTWALGGKTFKLKFGHHAANHPVQDLSDGHVEVTSQNHGFATDPDSLPDDVEVTHMNLNDKTVSGMRHKDLPVFSVQYHPEASPGPHDSLHLFRRFYDMVAARQSTKA